MTEQALPVRFVPEDGLDGADLSPAERGWARANGFSGQAGRLLAVPDGEGGLAGYLLGTGPEAGRPVLIAGAAGAGLPGGRYRLAGAHGDPTLAGIGFRLGAYRFSRYRTADPLSELEPPDGADHAEIARQAEAAYLARDLINTAPNDLGPDALEAAIRALATRHGAEMTVTKGDDLLAAGLPMIHAVGRASDQAPRLADLAWGRRGDPMVTLVGKGVTFDTGGLDIKSAAGMLLMKKDMGGAANVLGLAHALMDAGAPIRLRVLVPIVENAISAGAFRPGDVLVSRKGISVEIGNTDAEGRLILADALALADEEGPGLLVDLATLTGAARVALGPELPPLYSPDAGFAAALVEAGGDVGDPLWHMPLWAPYAKMLKSRVADIGNAASGGFAGSITAALFLHRFVERASIWVHLDIYGWTPEARPGHPVGGADQGIRALYRVIRARYG